MKRDDVSPDVRHMTSPGVGIIEAVRGTIVIAVTLGRYFSGLGYRSVSCYRDRLFAAPVADHAED